MKSKNLLIILIIVIIILTIPVTILAINYYNYLLAPATITSIEGAPGCTKCSGGKLSCMLPPGGCFGESRITDLKVVWNVGCIGVAIDNCQGGVLKVVNNLNQPFAIGDLEINAKKGDILYMELYKDTNNETKVRQLSSYFPQYLPEQDTTLSINAKCPDHEMTISYTKTKKMCE